ncbi:hypothetical protein BDV96DRAFT_8996 [Lophiotrema nucula]|uniref:C2H2-type domain-containing protein n=1 Tax=Lophiotrema nucula TaxID=690887 RepID=A0A6A5ZT06_9PLEO|nr:hypothetical protein BDV96DRAFT_8996 [Lophiotrema nucula]
MQQCLEDIQEYVQLLNELHPSIEAFLDLSEDHSVPTFKDASDRGAYLYFSDIVRTRFSAISEELADALGMLNLERYNRMSAEREANLKTSLDVPETESVAPKTVSFHDSGIGSSVPSANAPSVRTSSLRAPSIRAPSVVASSVSAPSVAASSMFSALAGKSRSRLPSLPKNAGTGSFSCDYCGKQVRYRSKRDWHRHLIKDLRPYSCLDSTCPWSRQVLPGRLDFVEHLATRHQMGPEWKSQYCGLCESWTEAGKIGVCKHFADHLEDIAIAASPLNITSEDGSDVDSVGSHGADQRAKGGLDPIKEDDEDNEKVIAAAGSLRNSRSRDERAIEDILRATGIDVDMTPNCAICNSPPYPECSCESEALDLALKQAEKQALGDRREGARDWVISHSRNHILNAFEKLSSARKQAFAAYLSTLPNYAIFMQYNGHPPIHSTDLSQLKACIIEAQAELKRGINADWRASVLRYPEVLDYFYSLVSLDLPDDSSPAVMHPRITRSANAPVPEASTQTGRRRGQAAQSSTAAESVPESVPGYHSPRYYASPSRTPEYVPIYEPEPASSKKKRRSNRARPPGSKASRSAPGSPE